MMVVMLIVLCDDDGIARVRGMREMRGRENLQCVFV